MWATYSARGDRVVDVKNQFAQKELAWWLPRAPAKLIDPRPKVALEAKTADIYVTRDGLIYASDWNAGLHVLEYEGCTAKGAICPSGSGAMVGIGRSWNGSGFATAFVCQIEGIYVSTLFHALGVVRVMSPR